MNSDKWNSLIWWVGIGATSMFVSVFLGTGVMAKTYELSQQIVSDQCGATTYDMAVGQVHEVFCLPFEPDISRYTIEPGKIVTYGAFDATNTRMDYLTSRRHLRVEAAGVSYVLGIATELGDDGNAWWLDISDRYDELFNDTRHTVRVTTVNHDDEELVTYGWFQLQERQEPEGEPAIEPGAPEIIRPDDSGLSGTGVSLWTALILSGMMVVGSIGLIIYNKHKQES